MYLILSEKELLFIARAHEVKKSDEIKELISLFLI